MYNNLNLLCSTKHAQNLCHFASGVQTSVLKLHRFRSCCRTATQANHPTGSRETRNTNSVSRAPVVGGLSRRLRYMYLHLPFFSCRKVYNNVFECIYAGTFGHHLCTYECAGHWDTIFICMLFNML